MDAFPTLGSGIAGTLPDEPGPTSYHPVDKSGTIGGGRFSTSNVMSDVDWVIKRSKSTPGPGFYGMPKFQKVGGGRFSSSMVMSEIDWVVKRSKDIPGPSSYGTPALPQKEGVPFGPTGGPREYMRPRPMTAPQMIKARDAANMPGPGSYKAIDSMGIQVQSQKRSPMKCSFGSGTRSQRKKICKSFLFCFLPYFFTHGT